MNEPQQDVKFSVTEEGPAEMQLRRAILVYASKGGGSFATVHDIAAIPQEGLSFAVYQPANLNSHRRPPPKRRRSDRQRPIGCHMHHRLGGITQDRCGTGQQVSSHLEHQHHKAGDQRQPHGKGGIGRGWCHRVSNSSQIRSVSNK